MDSYEPNKLMTAIGRIVELLGHGEDFCVATVTRSQAPGAPVAAKAIWFPGGRVERFGLAASHEAALAALAAQAFAEGRSQGAELGAGVTVFLDVRAGATRLLICGAGHIAVALARFVLETGFAPTVLDDRPEYASPPRFPGCRVVAEEFGGALRRRDLGPFRYVVVITRGHARDLDCLREVLRWEIGYVGLIGSRRRIGIVKACLEREGFSRSALEERLFAPIGLPIGSESPEEIALGIAAELVCVRRLGLGSARDLRRPGWGAA